MSIGSQAGRILFAYAVALSMNASIRMYWCNPLYHDTARRIDGREINELKYRGVVLNVVGHEMNQRAIALYAKFGLRHQKAYGQPVVCIVIRCYYM